MDASLEKKLENFAVSCINLAKKMHRSDISKDIRDLWKMLTVDRRSSINDYFQKAQARRAYVGYYFPMYVAKISLLLERLKRENHFEHIKGKPLKIWDLGSGTLTGVAALKIFFKDQPFKAHAVDKSLAPMRLGLDVLKDVVSADIVHEVTLRQGNLLGPKSAYLPFWKPNFIFLGHVVNELGEGQRAIQGKINFVTDLLNQLEPEGLMLIVEPATRNATRNLMALRDYFAHSEDYSIIAPCTGADTCPLLETPSSWCFSELKWQRPQQFRVIDDSIGFEREALKTSFLLISRSAPKTSQALRVVSGPMTQGTTLRRYVCTKDGLRTFEVKSGSKVYAEGNSILRGDTLADHVSKSPDVKIYRED